ncbi:glycosyltransferase family 2 protein [Amedibacillus sp. YH-ame6]
MKEPLVSVIIPVYNAQNYVSNTVSSILNQDYKNIEIILVNDGSKDNSKAVIEDLIEKDSRISLIDQENMGVSETRNRGIENAKGEYLMFVDSDDFLKANVLKGMVDSLPSECSMLFGGYAMMKGNFKDKKSVQEFAPLSSEIIIPEDIRNIYDVYYLNKIFLSIWGKLYRTDIIKQYNIRFKKDFKIGEDMLFIQDILTLDYPVYSYDKILYEYMLSTSNSITKTGSLSRITNAEQLLYKSLSFANDLKIDKDKMEIFPNYFLRTCFVTIENSSKTDRKELVRAILQNDKLNDILKNFEFKFSEDKLYKLILQSKSYILINLFTAFRKVVKRLVK